jgi:heat shock 70kDa protein 4
MASISASPSDKSATEQQQQKTVLGIDIGTTKMTVSSVTFTTNESVVTPIVLSSDTGSKSIPPLIGFRDRSRKIGEPAALEENSNAKNTVKDLIYFLGSSNVDNNSKATTFSPNKYRQFQLEHSAEHNNAICAVVNYNNKETKLRLELLISMLIRTARSYSKATGIEGVSITVPVTYTELQRKALVDAIRISEMKPLPCINICEAMGTMFEIKHRERIMEACAEDKKYNVVMLDIGHTTTNVGIVQYSVDNNNDNDEKTITCKTLSSLGKTDLGARNIDNALFNEVASILSTKYKMNVTPASKVGSRILRQCNKAKEILSTIGETSIVLENLPGDIDARIPVSKSMLEESSKDVAMELQTLFNTLFEQKGGNNGDETATSTISKEDIHVIEISGGGVRIPFIKRLIENTISNTAKCQTTLSPEASSKAAAMTAAKLINTTKERVQKVENEEKKEGEEQQEGEKEKEKKELAENLDVVGNMDENDIQMAIGLEQVMQIQDDELAEIGNARNTLESYIYEMRSVCNGNAGNEHYKLLNTDKLLPLLMETEDWMYESDDYTKENYVEKLHALEATFKETSPAYFEAVEKERLKIESELNEGEKIGDQERALESENAEDDHDRRKLKKDDRMRLVVRNKDEGTELFKGGVYKQAAIRYTKALQNCSKFFDLSADDEKEVNEIKVKLHLNIAMCFLKLKNNHKVINNCTDALELEKDNVKALFRRATAYYNEKKIKEAKSDLKNAMKINPDDKVIKKLNAKLDLVIKKQKAKEKKMAQRMFG